MVRPLSIAAVAVVALAGSAGAVEAQTWGQPVYVSQWGRGVGGTPLSEVETRSYVNTGRWADGYSDHVSVRVPAAAYGRGDGHGRGYPHDGRYGHSRPHRGDGYGHGYGRYEPRAYQGYRDAWGYNDDRHPSARRASRERRHERDCGCGDVYLYDR